MRTIPYACMALVMMVAPACAFGVGERHLSTISPTAALRDVDHRADLRITIWYPAPDGVLETRRVIGPSSRPFFEGGSACDDARIAPSLTGWPVVLLSHGFGGSARMMSWFGTEIARNGNIVVAVDHPGNNMTNTLTVPGAALWWDRAEDLRIAWDAVRTSAQFANQVDPARLGAAGFSAGGFKALVAAGARVDLARFDAFCAAHSDDGVCRPQVEMAGISGADRSEAFKTDDMQAEERVASLDHAVPGIRAAFVMAPALVQALDPASLERMASPLRIVLGSDDPVAPPATNGEVAAKLVPHAALSILDGVGHYDFLATCTEAGRAALPICHTEKPQADTHREVIERAAAFFATTLRPAGPTSK